MADLNNVSYRFGSFCGSVQQVEQMLLPNMEKRGVEWAENALLLYKTNPASTMQLISDIIRRFPEKLYENNKIYLVNDLIRIYQELDMEKVESMDIDSKEFIAGFQSKICDFTEEFPEKLVEKPLETPPVTATSLKGEREENTNSEVELSFLLGILIAKLQFVEEVSDANMEKRGVTFVEDILILLNTNVESCLQILVGVLSRLPAFCMVGPIFVTSREIQDLFQYLSIDKLKHLTVQKEALLKGYKKQVLYFQYPAIFEME